MSIYSRNFSTTSQGGNFNIDQRIEVWTYAKAIPDYPPGEWRYDICGTPIQWSAYGTTGKYGWEIDHIIPVAKGGTDHISNLQALQWQYNRVKSDSVGINYCLLPVRVTA